jgi:hypothetical protein
MYKRSKQNGIICLLFAYYLFIIFINVVSVHTMEKRKKKKKRGICIYEMHFFMVLKEVRQ